jgi:hypothetical protein
MCCLKYEQDYYEQTLKRLPKLGKDIMTPDGAGVVTEISPIRERVKVRIHAADDTFDNREYSVEDVRRMGPDDTAAVRELAKPDRHPRHAPESVEQPPQEDKRKRFPHQKALKNLSTDQFLEKLSEEQEQAPEPAPQPKPEKPRGERRPSRRRVRGEKGPANREVDQLNALDRLPDPGDES